MEHQYGEATIKHQRDELFNIGHVENRSTWARELAEKVGTFDREELNRRLRMQVDSDSTYFDEHGRLADKEVATVLMFDTGYVSLAKRLPVFARYQKKKTAKTGRCDWSGVSFVEVDSLRNAGRVPRKQANDLSLFEFAYLPGEWESDLSSMALDEPWTVDSRPFGVLRSYITNTFSRLWYEKKVLVRDGSCAAFNTGLVDRHYDPIIAYFTRNHIPNRQNWILKFFCSYGSGPQGKECAGNIKQLPQPAQWFDSIDQIYLDPAAEIVPSWEHFVYDNMDRIPVKLIKRNMPNDANVRAMLDDAAKIQEWSARKSAFDKLCDEIRASSDYEYFDYNMRAAFDAAVKLAMKKVRWNFGMAVPMFYPTRRSYSFLLPLALENPSVVDLALVINKIKDSCNHYQAQTILTMGMAYNNARLLRRPETPWLRECFPSHAGKAAA